jgi:hypothetical protein
MDRVGAGLSAGECLGQGGESLPSLRTSLLLPWAVDVTYAALVRIRIRIRIRIREQSKHLH